MAVAVVQLPQRLRVAARHAPALRARVEYRHAINRNPQRTIQHARGRGRQRRIQRNLPRIRAVEILRHRNLQICRCNAVHHRRGRDPVRPHVRVHAVAGHRRRARFRCPHGIRNIPATRRRSRRRRRPCITQIQRRRAQLQRSDRICHHLPRHLRRRNGKHRRVGQRVERPCIYLRARTLRTRRIVHRPRPVAPHAQSPHQKTVPRQSRRSGRQVVEHPVPLRGPIARQSGHQQRVLFRSRRRAGPRQWQRGPHPVARISGGQGPAFHARRTGQRERSAGRRNRRHRHVRRRITGAHRVRRYHRARISDSVRQSLDHHRTGRSRSRESRPAAPARRRIKRDRGPAIRRRRGKRNHRAAIARRGRHIARRPRYARAARRQEQRLRDHHAVQRRLHRQIGRRRGHRRNHNIELIEPHHARRDPRIARLRGRIADRHCKRTVQRRLPPGQTPGRRTRSHGPEANPIKRQCLARRSRSRGHTRHAPVPHEGPRRRMHRDHILFAPRDESRRSQQSRLLRVDRQRRRRARRALIRHHNVHRAVHRIAVRNLQIDLRRTDVAEIRR